MRFRDALAAPGLGAIAEIKRRSPSAGDLRADADPAALAAAFERAGAAALSVLVDGASAARSTTCAPRARRPSLPLLGKGFFSEEDDFRELKEAGADAALILLRDVDDGRGAS